MPFLRQRGARLRGLSLLPLRHVHLPHLHLSRHHSVRIVPRGDTRSVTTIVASAAIAPINREPDVREEQVSQLVLGETAQQLAADRDWLRIRTDADL